MLALIKLLPELLALVKAIQIAIEKTEADRKVNDDLKTITDAFNSGDASKLHGLFSNPG